MTGSQRTCDPQGGQPQAEARSLSPQVQSHLVNTKRPCHRNSHQGGSPPSALLDWWGWGVGGTMADLHNFLPKARNLNFCVKYFKIFSQHGPNPRSSQHLPAKLTISAGQIPAAKDNL